MHIRIESTHARLGLNIEYPQVQISSEIPRARVETERPAVQIDIDWPRVELDLTAPLAEIGLKRSPEIGRELKEKGVAAALRGIADTARLGDILAEFERYENVAAVFGQLVWPIEEKELNVALAPTSPVQVEAQGDVDISFRLGSVKVYPTSSRVKVDARLGGVTGYMIEKPSVKIEAVGKRFSSWA